MNSGIENISIVYILIIIIMYLHNFIMQLKFRSTMTNTQGIFIQNFLQKHI